MNVLITGASGFIGGHLICALHKKNAKITALTRNPSKFKGRGVNAIKSLDTISDNANFDLIVNLAGASISKRWKKSYKKEILDSRIETTKALHDLVKRLKKKPKTVISASAIGYYGNQGDTPLTEDSAPVSGFTHELCNAWEKEAQRMGKMGCRVFIIRLGVVLGKDGGMLREVLPIFRMGLGGKIGSGTQYLSWVHIDDVVRAIFFLLESKKRGGIYNFTTPKPVTNMKWTRALANTLRRPAPLPLPKLLVKLMFGEMGESLLLSGQRVLPTRLAKEGFDFRHSQLEKVLGNLIIY